jgi:uncharacterized protein (DUF111 family)
MKIAYFDCRAGASGETIIGALVDAGLPVESLRGGLANPSLLVVQISLKDERWETNYQRL